MKTNNNTLNHCQIGFGFIRERRLGVTCLGYVFPSATKSSYYKTTIQDIEEN